MATSTWIRTTRPDPQTEVHEVFKITYGEDGTVQVGDVALERLLTQAGYSVDGAGVVQ